MSDWIHCNKCFLRFRPSIKFFITNCGHLQCQICISKKGPENRCLVCNSVAEMIELSNDINPDVMSFFQPAKQAIDKTNQVAEFQLNNVLSLLKNMTAKYTGVKQEIANNNQLLQEAKRHQDKLKMLLKAAARSAPGGSSTCGSTSLMSGNTSSIFTPSSNISSSFLQFDSCKPRTLPWNQRQNVAKMMIQRHYPGVGNVSSSTLDSSNSVSQDNSSAPFDLAGSPNEQSHGRPLPSQNTFMGSSMSNHRRGWRNKPR